MTQSSAAKRRAGAEVWETQKSSALGFGDHQAQPPRGIEGAVRRVGSGNSEDLPDLPSSHRFSSLRRLSLCTARDPPGLPSRLRMQRCHWHLYRKVFHWHFFGISASWPVSDSMARCQCWLRVQFPAGVEAASWSSSAASSSARSLAMTRTSLRVVSSQWARRFAAWMLPVRSW